MLLDTIYILECEGNKNPPIVDSPSLEVPTNLNREYGGRRRK
jgi:hypothetical protein